MKTKALLGLICTFLIVGLSMHYYAEQKHPSFNFKSETSYDKVRAQKIKKKTKRLKSGINKHLKPTAYYEFLEKVSKPIGAESSTYQMNYTVKELAKAQQRLQKARRSNQSFALAEKLNWKERGPGTQGGRTRSLIVDPDDPTLNTWFAGSVTGGIWKTTDAGKHWQPLTDNLAALKVGCMMMAPSDHNVIYAGTGESYNSPIGSGNRGFGIYKSIDKGETWTQLSTIAEDPNFEFVNRLVIDPLNSDIVVAATTTGVFKTIDGGVNWEQKMEGRINQVVASSDFKTQYAGVYFDGIYKSIDAGNNWGKVYDLRDGRLELAIAPSDNNVVYISSQKSTLHYTSDAGISWHKTKVLEGTERLFLAPQGVYNNSITVDPNNPEIIYIGGINTYRVQLLDQYVDELEYNEYKDNIDSFFKFIGSGGDAFYGTVEYGRDAEEDKISFEVRFGPDCKQKAHRFTVPDGATNGVPDEDYTYQNYIEVPFEVWDVDNNRQLMVSFRDQEANGIFNLSSRSDYLKNREYIQIHNITYSETPNNSIIELEKGIAYKRFAFIWPALTNGDSYDLSTAPESKFGIRKELVKKRGYNSQTIGYWNARNTDKPFVHADVHCIKIIKGVGKPYRILIGNDGGVTYSDNYGVSWNYANGGYVTTQFYDVVKHPTKDFYLGGTQDNGTQLSLTENPDKQTPWREIVGGDGFDCIWQTFDQNKVLASVYSNSLYIRDLKSHVGFTSKQNPNFDVGDFKASFFTPLGTHPSCPDRIFAIGTSGFWISNDFTNSWKKVELPEGYRMSIYPRIVVSEVDPDIVWIFNGNSTSYSSYVSTNGGYTFKKTAFFTEESFQYYVCGGATHPKLPHTAFQLYGVKGAAKVLRTDDLGETWTDLTQFGEDGKSQNGFPDVMAFCLQVMPHNPKEIWVGTEIGLFISTDTGKSWHYSDNGLPAVPITRIKAYPGQLVLATYGRGIWSVDIPELETVGSCPGIVSNFNDLAGNWNFVYETITDLDSINFYFNKTKLFTSKKVKAHFRDMLILAKTEKLDTFFMEGYKNGITYKSHRLARPVFSSKEVVTRYYTGFEGADTLDFKTDYFKFNQPEGFTNRAVHSSHPYENYINSFLYLNYLIRVKATSAGCSYLEYDDIPMLEFAPGGEIYDYAQIEATKNGYEWVRLEPVYDFLLIKDLVANQGILSYDGIATEKCYTHHKINLLEKFSEGDTISIRFNMHTDSGTTGWGWAIDNLNIQDPSTSSQKEVVSKTTLYPTKVDEFFYISLDNTEWKNDLTVDVYKLSGQLVAQKTISPSRSSIQMDVKNLSSGIYIVTLHDKAKKQNFKIQIIK